MKAVLRHTFGFAAIASIFEATKSAPAAGRWSGCSDWWLVGMIQLTAGRRSPRASSSKVPSGCGRTPRSYRSEPGHAFLKAANCSSMLQP